MPDIELKSISNFICNKVNLKIFDKELFVLLGSNGAGKSTLLNIIAGLTNYEGEVLFDKININKLPTRKRKIGYLFQDLHLFPHFNVFSNIAFSLKIMKKNVNKTESRVEELLDLLKIKNLANRYPRELSGGGKTTCGSGQSIVLRSGGIASG